MLYKIGFLNDCVKFTGKYLSWNLFSKVAGLQLATLLKKSLRRRSFPAMTVYMFKSSKCVGARKSKPVKESFYTAWYV